jgi:hypothetical protein
VTFHLVKTPRNHLDTRECQALRAGFAIAGSTKSLIFGGGFGALLMVLGGLSLKKWKVGGLFSPRLVFVFSQAPRKNDRRRNCGNVDCAARNFNERDLSEYVPCPLPAPAPAPPGTGCTAA